MCFKHVHFTLTCAVYSLVLIPFVVGVLFVIFFLLCLIVDVLPEV